MSEPNHVHRYRGAEIDITWDDRLCIHDGSCVRSDGHVFVKGRRPWADPDEADVETVLAIIARCPSGALHATRTDGDAAESPDPVNTVRVVANGPLEVRGDLAVGGATPDMRGVACRTALCRCGLSRSKPFCDNSHRDAGFVDDGAIATNGPAGGADDDGGPLTITAMENGPLKLAGNVTICSPDGEERWRGGQVALCRCGRSAKKPFCDASHKAADFTAPGAVPDRTA